eukprot:516429_1
MYYCNTNCQRNNWKTHKKQCCFNRKKSNQQNTNQYNSHIHTSSNNNELHTESNDNEYEEEEQSIEHTCSNNDQTESDQCNFEPQIPFKYKYLSPSISLRTIQMNLFKVIIITLQLK